MSLLGPVPVHDDTRGRLVAVEFDDLPFVPRRSFVVVAPGHPVSRGGHHAACRELIVVVSGTATVHLRDASGTDTSHHLVTGDRLLVDADHWMSYDLTEATTTLLVLADAPFDTTVRSRKDAEA
jgi:hypothetical protein